MARWLPPNGFTCTVHQLDAKVGGTYRMSFTDDERATLHVGGQWLANEMAAPNVNERRQTLP
jgi:uncharacterized protein YndB with AHSA1/START domain